MANVYERLEKQILVISDPSKYTLYLNRLIQSCSCLKDATFPITTQDQDIIDLFLRVSLKSLHAKRHLEPTLKNVLTTMCSAASSNLSSNDHHNFIIGFFVRMVKMECEMTTIALFIFSLPLNEDNHFHLQLFLNTSRVLVNSLSNVEGSPPMKLIGVNKTSINLIVDISMRFIR